MNFKQTLLIIIISSLATFGISQGIMRISPMLISTFRAEASEQTESK